MPLYGHGSLRICPMRFFTFPYRILILYFGTITMWYYIPASYVLDFANLSLVLLWLPFLGASSGVLYIIALFRSRTTRHSLFKSPRHSRGFTLSNYPERPVFHSRWGLIPKNPLAWGSFRAGRSIFWSCFSSPLSLDLTRRDSGKMPLLGCQ
jgi:hypothetical protein